MTDNEKIAAVESALRTERDYLRGRTPAGVQHQRQITTDLRTANVLNDYLLNALPESMVRFYDLLVSCETRAEAEERLS